MTNKETLDNHEEQLPDFYDIFDVLKDPQDLARIQEKIQTQHGEVFVFVHPFFKGIRKMPSDAWLRLIHLAGYENNQYSSQFQAAIKAHPKAHGNNHSELLAKYILQLKQFIKIRGNDCIIIAEESEAIPDTTRLFRAMGLAGELLFCPTLPANPEPEVRTAFTLKDTIWEEILRAFDHDFQNYRLTPQRIADKRWNALTQAINTLGIHTMAVGGQYSYLNHEELPPVTSHIISYEYGIHDAGTVFAAHDGCVGGFMKRVLLAQQRLYPTDERFKLFFSPITYPNTEVPINVT